MDTIVKQTSQVGGTVVADKSHPAQKTAVAKPGVRTTASATFDKSNSFILEGEVYSIKDILPEGAEAEVFVVSGKDDVKRVLKKYKKGFNPNAKVLNALEPLRGRGYYPESYSFHIGAGETDFSYELMEFFQVGSSSSYDLKGDSATILFIIEKAAMCLEQFHDAGVIHKDIKPANILLKDNEGKVDVAIGDFGISDLLVDGSSSTLQSRTPVYAAPEVYDSSNTVVIDGMTYCNLTPKADFYSLGMTLLSLWYGESAFKSKENEMAFRKTKGGIPVPEDMPEPLATIAKGLLIRNPLKRWDYNEIEAFLNGQPVSCEEDEIIDDLNIVFNASENKIAHSPKELADLMLDDYDLGLKYLYRGKLRQWMTSRPEIEIALEDITEKKFPKNQERGFWSAIFLLDPSFAFKFTGLRLDNDEKETVNVSDPVSLASFWCSHYDFDSDTVTIVASIILADWIETKDSKLGKLVAGIMPSGDTERELYDACLRRIYVISPLSDIHTYNNPDSEFYAMTGERLASVFQMAYDYYWSGFGGDATSLESEWTNSKDANSDKKLNAHLIVLIADSFRSYEGSLLEFFLKSKGMRFRDQDSWVRYCTDRKSKDNAKKAGPKDLGTLSQIAAMKTIKGLGLMPHYFFANSSVLVETLDELAKVDSEEVAEEMENGLKGWLAVQYQENPDVDLSEQYSYESLLSDYLEKIGEYNPDDREYERYESACFAVDGLCKLIKKKVNILRIRTIAQNLLVIALALIPSVLLVIGIVLSIIDNPVLDVAGMKYEVVLSSFGMLVAVVLFFKSDNDYGCLFPLIVGAAASFVLFILIKFLGRYVLYLYLAVVLAVIIWLSVKTLFASNSAARGLRSQTKPGFEEYILEPLYYAFSKERSFDSSVSGAFSSYAEDEWKDHIAGKRKYIIIFVVAVWLLIGLSFLLPKSEKADTFNALFGKEIEMADGQADNAEIKDVGNEKM